MKQGWEIKKLGEVAEYFNGLTYSPKDVSNNGTIVLRSSNIQNDVLDFSDIVRVNVDIKEKLFLKEGDILMCSRNGSQRLVGKTAPILNLSEPMTFGTFMMIIRSEFSPYLLWFFKTDEFKKQISGGENTMINQVTRYMLDEIKIPLPPLPEQKRIVSLLEEAFAAIAKAKANAEQNLKNARELFESYLQGVFQKKGEGMEEKKLGEVLVKTETVDPTKNPDTEFTYLDVSSVNKETKEIENPTVLLGKDAPSRAKKLIRTGDVIFATVRPTHSRVALIPEEFDEQVCSTGYFVLRTKESVNNKLVFYFLLTKGFNEQMEKLQKGASYPAVTDNDVKGILFSFLKSKEAQQTIVRQLDALRAETQKLEAVYQKKIADMEELKKSILQKAFAGELRIEKVETV
ncbi:MAG: restriction endonuclease subunit S [Flavobacterium sp.]|nr:restriction endonuclease subunit S [Flavobacterium sp.]MCZ8168650.1 restriction endonuclease subunit S [Flavobacterium sp.]MCZ8298163.1 restriction endonuclease subunit S [Flavobacterium sp.]